MVHTRTLKLKKFSLHPGRVRKPKAGITQQQCHLQSLHKQAIQTHSQKQLVNYNASQDLLELSTHSNFQDNTEDISLYESASTSKNVLTHESDTSSHNTQNSESNVSAYNFQDVIESDNSSDQDNDDFFETEEDSNIDNLNTNNFSQKVANEPTTFEPFSSNYGLYFTNFTEQMLFLWITKYMICK